MEVNQWLMDGRQENSRLLCSMLRLKSSCFILIIFCTTLAYLILSYAEVRFLLKLLSIHLELPPLPT